MATVRKRFKDKFTKKSYAPGMSYEADPERIAFLQRAGHLYGSPPPAPVEPAKDPEVDEVIVPEPEPDDAVPVLLAGEPATETPIVADTNEYQLMTNADLEKELKKRGIEFRPRATKPQLIALLTGKKQEGGKPYGNSPHRP